MTIKPAFGLYIHWPFCARKCPYCDFNSHVSETIDHAKWLEAYQAELRHFANDTSDRIVTSVFFGGGTPSLMKPQVIEAILTEIRGLWRCSESIEITAEANPSSSEAALFRDFRQAGINRLSIGVQSFDNAELQFLGRLHDGREAIKAIEAAQATFDCYSFDMIYALPNQTPENWENALNQALTYTSDHMSLYQLTIEPGTQFHKDRIEAADEDVGFELYEITQKIMQQAGLPAYEISNHAQKGAESRHNLVYWRGQDYLGIGPGAHGRLSHSSACEMMHNFRNPGSWLEKALTIGHGQQKRSALSPEERRDEIIMMGLRLSEGIDGAHFKALTGMDLNESLDQNRLKALESEGYIDFSEVALKATSEGRQRLNAVTAHLLA